MQSQSAFLELLNQHRAVVYKLSRLYARDLDEQHDLFQEMVLQALTAWSRFEARAQFSTWLYRVCLNTALSWQRREQKRKQAEADSMWELENQNDPRHAQAEWLLEHMRRLDPTSRMLLSLKLDGYSMAEIADITGLNVNQATVKIHRAKNQLTQWLQQNPLSI